MRNSETRAASWLRSVLAMFAASMLIAAPASAQDVTSFDPDDVFNSAEQTAQDTANSAIDADLADPALRDNLPEPPVVDPSLPTPVPPRDLPAGEGAASAGGFDNEFSQYAQQEAGQAATDTPTQVPPIDEPYQVSSDTYGQDDLIGAAEGVFGKGAQGLAGLIEDLLREQGEPNGYIVGREGGGAFIFGVRYGSGTLHHRIEGERRVFWTGPSLGLDAGANAGNTFVLVYNLFDTEDIFKRYPAGEGQAYLVGGLHASYMRRGDVVLIPIRVGAGLRLGVNAGYMRFSKKHRWLPF